MLCERMLDPSHLKKFLVSQDDPAFSAALSILLNNQLQITTDEFEEAFGPFRVAGVDKIIREKMWKNPISVTEELWYHGLIFRENRLINGELKECFILPEDIGSLLSNLLPQNIAKELPKQKITVRPAIPSETVSVSPFSLNLPDLLCLALALKRDDRPLVIPGANLSESEKHFLDCILDDGDFFSNNREPDAEKIRKFLIQNKTISRIESIRFWRNSERFNELAEVPEINIITAPVFSVREPREHILDALSALPVNTWLSLNGFIAAIKKTSPQFLRKSFFENRGQIIDKDGNDLSGIGAWFQLEGSYIRFLITGPLQWLGLAQIGYEDKTRTQPSSFCLSSDFSFFMRESKEEKLSEALSTKPNLEQAVPIISSDGAITSSNNVPRYFRYMTARFCEIENVKADNTSFRITPASLSNAESNGLDRASFLALLRRFSKNKVPPSMEHLLSSGTAASLPATIYQAVILTIPEKDIFNELLFTPRLEKWLNQQINETSILIDPKGISEIRRFLMEREIFVDIQIES